MEHSTIAVPDASVADASAAAGTPPAPSRRKYQVYLLIVVAFPVLFLSAAIPIVRSASFPNEAADPFLLNPDYPFSFKHADCEVLIFGDSTAETGIDPTMVERTTGMKTCNIAQSRSAVEILGPLALDTYLENNVPPKVLVMQFAPETLSRDQQNLFWPEGLTLLLRKKPLPQALLTMAAHPVEAYRFAVWAIKMKFAALVQGQPDFRATEALFQSRGGLIVLPKPAQQHCTANLHYRAPDLSWVQGLRRKYSVNGTRVLVDVSPLPTCAPEVSQAREDLQTVTDNPLPVYPIGLFCDIDRHLTLQGAERLSEEIGRQILSSNPPP